MKDNINTLDLFNKIWKDVIVPISNEISNNHGLRKCYKKAKYIAQRRFYKESQVFVQSYMVDKTRNIDRHKIASCMLKSILIAKPLKMPFGKKVLSAFNKLNITDEARLANQYLAISVAITILDGYIQSDSHKQMKHKICFPEPFPNEDTSYIKDMCLDLYYTQARNINTITYANVFFLLEKYSCRKTQCKNLEDALRGCLTNSTMTKDKATEYINEVKFKNEGIN